jgi:hypothetical protein
MIKKEVIEVLLFSEEVVTQRCKRKKTIIDIEKRCERC